MTKLAAPPSEFTLNPRISMSEAGYGIIDEERTSKSVLRELLGKERKAKAALLEALIWCSGASDFKPDGIARAGWLKMCKPLIDAN